MKNKVFFSNKKTIRRSILFSITLIAVVFSMILDLYIKGDSLAYYLVFWTHFSNIGVLIWSTVALFSAILRNKKLEKFISQWWTKGIVSTFIIVTGSIFLSVSYFPLVFKYIHYNDPSLLDFVKFDLNIGGINSHVADLGWNKNPQENFIINNFPTYCLMIIIGTTFLHIFVPLLMTWETFAKDGKLNKKFTENEKIEITFMAMILPTLYFVWVVMMNAGFGVQGPYPVLNFANLHSDPSIQYTTKWLFFSIFCDLIVLILYSSVLYLIMWYSSIKSKVNKNKL